MIGTTQELKQVWSAKRFLFPDSVTGQTGPAMVVRLPRGQYWGFSLRVPFGTCELEYVSDLEILRRDYQFNADHPMIVNPCDHTIYDLLRYGSSSAGLVRGDIVQGTGIRPPMAIEIRERGKEVVAVRMECALRPNAPIPHIEIQIDTSDFASVLQPAQQSPKNLP